MATTPWVSVTQSGGHVWILQQCTVSVSTMASTRALSTT